MVGFRLRRLLVAATLLLGLDSWAVAETAPKFSNVQQAIGMPGSLGISGLDALTEFCTGRRETSFRRDMFAIIAKVPSEKQRAMLTKFYDKRYGEWLAWHEQALQTEESRVKHCSSENIEHSKTLFWGKMAKEISYPGF